MTNAVTPPSLQGQTILVTGAAHRIGKAIASHLATEGAQVVIHYNHSAEAAEDLALQLRETGAHVATIGANLDQLDAVETLIARATKAIGAPLTCLINNASRFDFDNFQNATKESWTAHMVPNLQAPFMLMQAFAQQLPAGQQGNIINLIDQRVWRLNPEFTTYTLSKAGLWTLTQTAAMALAPRIRVNAIGPGPVLQSIHQSEDVFEDEAAHVPLGQSTSLDEIARTVQHILETPSMTGQMIALDGGQHLAWQTPDFHSFKPSKP